jgi:hypothetical protein
MKKHIRVVPFEFIDEAKPIDDHPRPRVSGLGLRVLGLNLEALKPVDITAYMPIDFAVINHAACGNVDVL